MASCLPRLGGINLFLFCDGSPQWRGLELYAATLDFFHELVFKRFLLPAVYLSRGQLDALSKTVALLWQVSLLVGARLLQMYLSRVRAVLTDGGTERLILDSTLTIEEFFWYVKVRTPAGTRPRQPLFPRALRILGWKHQFDLILRKGLVNLDWFPAWLQQFKDLVRLVRDRNIVASLCKGLRRDLLSGLATLLEGAEVPSFAAWRWTTLDKCCRAVHTFLDSLRVNFDPTALASMRDTRHLQSVTRSLRSELFAQRFHFVMWYCRWLTQLLEWVGGCNCHRPSDPAAAGCDMRGRRIQQVHAYAIGVLQDGLSEAEAWLPGRFGGVPLHGLIGAVRAAYIFGRESVAYYDQIPLLAARLDEPGVRDRCLEQFASAPRAAHDRVSVYLFADEPGSLRAEVLAVGDDGSIPSDSLRDEVRSLQLIPLDDSVNEGPHARAARVGQHSRRAKVPWIASTMRLGANLSTIRQLQPCVEESLQSMWLRYKDASPHRGRMSRHRWERVFYQMAHCEEGGAPIPDDGSDDTGGGGDGGDGPDGANGQADLPAVDDAAPAPPRSRRDASPI